ncbi:MAG: PqqD family protein [Synergistaceae bacterium]|nr:PqqD family protein [Synergistaceae bacterium]
MDGFIVDLLKNDTSESEIINALLEKFDAPEDIITANVHETISKLQEINALEF